MHPHTARREEPQNQVLTLSASLCGSEGPSGIHTPLDTLARNLFTLGKPGSIRSEGVSGIYTPLDTPARNLFTPGKPGSIRNDQDCTPPGREPQVLFGDAESVSSDETMIHNQSRYVSLSHSRSQSSFGSSDSRSAGLAATATTISQAWSSSDSSSNSDNYLETCRLLGLSPMVQPAKRRRWVIFTEHRSQLWHTGLWAS